MGLDLFRLAKKINVLFLFFRTKFTKKQYFVSLGIDKFTASMPLVVIQVTFEKFTTNKLQDKTTEYRLSPAGICFCRQGEF